MTIDLDTVTYFTSIMGMFRAGFTVFTISTRNSAEAVRHLLTTTNTKHLLISQEPRIVALAEAALEDGLPISTHHMPEFADIYVSDETTPYTYPSGVRDPDAPALILHSSGTSSLKLKYHNLLPTSRLGSTAFPKPIVRSARRLIEWTLIPCKFPKTYAPCDVPEFVYRQGMAKSTSQDWSWRAMFCLCSMAWEFCSWRRRCASSSSWNDLCSRGHHFLLVPT